MPTSSSSEYSYCIKNCLCCFLPLFKHYERQFDEFSFESKMMVAQAIIPNSIVFPKQQTDQEDKIEESEMMQLESLLATERDRLLGELEKFQEEINSTQARINSQFKFL